MIVTVTLNPALDVTYRVDRVVPGASHRVSAVTAVAGGKGVNVASVLTGLGVPVVAAGLLGGDTGARLSADLSGRRIRHDFARCAGETRRSVTVVSESDGEATVFNEPGPNVSPAEWTAFLAHLRDLLQEVGARVVVVSGSLPRGVPAHACGEVVLLARETGALTIVDTSGDALGGALPSGPDVVKPNRDELAEVTGLELAPGPESLVSGAGLLQDRGAHDVLVSSGSDGLVFVPSRTAGPAQEAGSGRPTASRAWLPTPLSGNPTGAGDAAVAAVAFGLSTGSPPERWLAEAVAWSAAAVLHPLAGQVRSDDVDRLRPQVLVAPQNRRASTSSMPRSAS